MKSEDNMAAVTRRRYTEDFKQETVRLVRESTRPVAQVARGFRHSGERAVSLAHSAPAVRDTRHHTSRATHRSRRAHVSVPRYLSLRRFRKYGTAHE